MTTGAVRAAQPCGNMKRFARLVQDDTRASKAEHIKKEKQYVL